ncbi:MAG: phosphatidylglycerol lysyltransferase domain-containing protein [Fimbriimonadaceae bacterium]
MTFAPLPGRDGVRVARELVLRLGWNTTCYQVLNRGIERWMASDGRAIIGFVERCHVRVVAGAPVCAEEDVSAVVRSWERQASEADKTVVYFGAEGRVLASTQGRAPYAVVVLGAQPVWSPANWRARFDACPNCRAQRSRARNKGVAVVEWDSACAEQSADIKRLLAEWLTTRGLPPMHFLVEPQTLGDLTGRRIFVAEVRGVPVGFLVASPIPCRNGWLTEQFVRGRAAPNGTIECLVDAAVSAIADVGSDYVTMGIVPLSHHASVADNPAWLNVLFAWARAHGRRFYNFDGLDAFKSKFQPEYWEPIYAISNEPRFSFRTLYAIVAAFSDGPVMWTLARAVTKAAWQEWRWISRW